MRRIVGRSGDKGSCTIGSSSAVNVSRVFDLLKRSVGQEPSSIVEQLVRKLTVGHVA